MIELLEEFFGMEQLAKLERMIMGWTKDLPHLPTTARKWLGENVWWIVVIGVVLSAFAVIGLLRAFFGYLGTFASPVISYYASPAVVGGLIVTTVVALVFVAVQLILLAFAINPLKERQKKGWTLLFVAWLVSAVATVVGAILTLNPLTMIGNLLFGAVLVAVTGYFLFEMHGQFRHTERSKGVKEKKA